jgi:hypothetical protein
MRSSVAMPSSASSEAKASAASSSSSGCSSSSWRSADSSAADRPVMAASAALTRSTPAVDADERHPDGGAVEGDLEAPLGLAAGALGAALAR